MRERELAISQIRTKLRRTWGFLAGPFASLFRVDFVVFAGGVSVLWCSMFVPALAVYVADGGREGVQKVVRTAHPQTKYIGVARYFISRCRSRMRKI